MFKKFLLSLLFLFFINTQVFAQNLSSSIDEVLSSFDFDRDSVVSISVREKDSNNVVYEKNPYKFLNPASVLKLFTMNASLNTLGADYTFDTAVFADKNNNLYIKLSGDPLLKEKDLYDLAKKIKEAYKGKIKKIFIDDSIIDYVAYPDGWTIDDYWPNSPKISPYMVDFNTVKFDIYLDENKKDIRIIQKNPYKFTFINKLTISDTTDIKFVQNDMLNAVNLEGTISDSVIGKEIPVLNPKYFFCMKLHDALIENGINYKDKFLFAKVPNNTYKVTKISRPIDEVIKFALFNSDNLTSEMVFKVAGAKYASEKTLVKNEFATFGTTLNAVNMFNDYYKNLGLDISQVKIKDGSGVSRYNVMNVNWITNALSKIDFDFEKYLPTPTVGTLQKRMRELKDRAYLKTGTLYGVSSLAGVIKTDDKEYYYSSIIMSLNRNKSLIKGVEDEIIYEIYRLGEYNE